MSKTEHQKILAITQGMLDGSIDYFTGAERLILLRDQLELPLNDPAFIPLLAVKEALTECLIKNNIKHSSQLTPKQLSSLMSEESIKWAKEISEDTLAQLQYRYQKEI